MKNSRLPLLLIIYLLLALSTLAIWTNKDINAVTGDEPHYLVMANGIVQYGSWEQTNPYNEEFTTRKIYRHGLAARGALPVPANTHAVSGPHGLYNIHNIGLPFLLALPFLWGGVIGAKIFMVLCGALVVTVIWKYSSIFSESQTQRFWAVLAVTISLPLLPAASQIYPDLLAGLIALVGLYWFLTASQKRSIAHEILWASLIAFLPWLQIKFAATAVLLFAAIGVRSYCQSKNLKRTTVIFLVGALSVAALALYNQHAFGKLTGPYQSGALEISKTSFMVLLGLHFDQNQGFLMQNPLHLIGVLALGWMYRVNPRFTFLWGLVFLSLIVPNALHPAWYGGASFSGRFGWAAATVFTVVTIFGLLELGKTRPQIFKSIIALSLLLQGYFFVQYAVIGVDIHNKGAATWFDAYPNMLYPIHSWLPALYNAEWALSYPQNYLWLVLIGLLFCMGFVRHKKPYNVTSVLVMTLAVIIFGAGFFDPKGESTQFNVALLPANTGKIIETYRIAEQHTDKPGFVNFGPYFPLRKGRYEVVLTYSSSGQVSKPIGLFDVYDATDHTQVYGVPIYSTNGLRQQIKLTFTLEQWQVHLYEFRTDWLGVSNLQVEAISIQKI